MKIDNVRHEYHRNGICGIGFVVATFDMVEDGVKRQMLGVLFPNAGECAVFDLDLLAQGIIAFGANSWRGDHFEDELRRYIETTQAKWTRRLRSSRRKRKARVSHAS